MLYSAIQEHLMDAISNHHVVQYLEIIERAGRQYVVMISTYMHVLIVCTVTYARHTKQKASTFSSFNITSGQTRKGRTTQSVSIFEYDNDNPAM